MNLSNHPNGDWSSGQRSAAIALGFGPIADFPFPDVPPEAGTEEIMALADRILGEITASGAKAVMIQGEFSLTYSLIRRFVSASIPCYAACSKRIGSSTFGERGATIRESYFEFVQFRRYEQ